MISAKVSEKTAPVQLGKIVVRRLEERDFASCIHMGARMHEDSPYRVMEYSPERCLEMGRRALVDPDYLWLVAEQDGGLVGMMGAQCVCPGFSAEKIAYDIAVYVEPARRGGRAFISLTHAALAWARERGAVMALFGDSTGAVGDMYRRIGFEQAGGIYRRYL